MNAFRDPPRLIDHAADPTLREALRVVSSDAPSLEALELLADRTEHAVQHGAAQGVAHATKLSTPFKLTLVSCAVGAAIYASRGLPDPRATPDISMRPVTSVEPGSSPHDGNVSKAPAKPRAAMEKRTIASDPAASTQSSEPETAETPGAVPTTVLSRGREQPARAPIVAIEPAKPRPTPRARIRVATNGKPEASRTAVFAGTPSERAQAEARSAPSELELLEEAQRALATDPTRSLELLSQHRTFYPTGAFIQERDVLQLDVLSSQRRTRELRAGARTFLERYPNSPHKARVQALLEDSRY